MWLQPPSAHIAPSELEDISPHGRARGIRRVAACPHASAPGTCAARPILAAARNPGALWDRSALAGNPPHGGKMGALASENISVSVCMCVHAMLA